MTRQKIVQVPMAALALLWLVAPYPATAELCSIDAVPAATLLLPYFEVDLDSSDGVTTLFSINNAEAAPALAHVVSVDGEIAQSHVSVLHSAQGVYSVGLQAIELHDACEPFSSHLNEAIDNGGTNSIQRF